MTKPKPQLEPRTCPCGIEFMPRQRNSVYHDRACMNAHRTARGRSEASKASSRKRDRAKAQQAFEDTQIVGLDGEGITSVDYMGDGDILTDPDDSNFWENHKYQGMVAYNETTGEERRIRCPSDERLRTGEILRWLWKVTTPDRTGEDGERGARKQPWFFASKYDWTAIFRDIMIEDVVSGDSVKQGVLWQVMHPDQTPDRLPRNPFEIVWWRDEMSTWWGIVYIQGTVTIYKGRRWDKKKQVWVACARRIFSDAFRCFAGGSSFVDMLRAWDVGDPAEVERVADMKPQRGGWRLLTDEIMDYCALEVKLLAQAVKKITAIFGDDPINIRPSAWYSAGSAAKCLLRNHQIPADSASDWDGYRGTDRYAGAPEDIKVILLRAYFGGWFENAETGLFEELHSEDFKSAYPSVIRDLPCLSHGHWEHVYNENAINFGHVEWESDIADGDDLRWAPFPWRYPNGRIYRPHTGEGWYCESEINAAMNLPNYQIDVIEWVSFVPECDHRPFDWVQDVYDQRVAWGGDGRGLALKVTLNSVYGVFADTLSLDSRYASIVWAAMITAGTRAKILDLMADHGDQIVAVATDGILSTKPVIGQKTKVLGELNYEGALYDVLLIQPGLHLATNGPDPKKTIRNRGHALKDMRDLEGQLRDAWLLHGWSAEVEYKRTRFIPAKLALARKDPLEVYGQWIEAPVTLKFKPSNREPTDTPGRRKRSVPSMRHILEFGADDEKLVSAPYSKFLSMLYNQSLIDSKELDDGQP